MKITFGSRTFEKLKWFEKSQIQITNFGGLSYKNVPITLLSAMRTWSGSDVVGKLWSSCEVTSMIWVPKDIHEHGFLYLQKSQSIRLKIGLNLAEEGGFSKLQVYKSAVTGIAFLQFLKETLTKIRAHVCLKAV